MYSSVFEVFMHTVTFCDENAKKYTEFLSVNDYFSIL